MRALRRAVAWLAGLGVAAMLGAVVWSALRARPQDLPWTPLDLGAPPGLFTGRKIAALTRDFPACRAALDRAGVRYVALPPRIGDDGCGYSDAIRPVSGGARRIDFSPTGLGVSCPVAAALAAWEWDVVQPAARRHLHAAVRTIEHLGSYSCRRLYGRDAGAWSEHATADAIDVAGFRLEDGRRVTVARDWTRASAASRFLHEVRDGACGLFSTTLSPDYNAAHRDHLHLDQAERGATGWRGCR